MPRVRMLTLSAGPNGVREPGQEYIVPDKEAKMLIAGEHAEYVDPAPELDSVSKTEVTNEEAQEMVDSGEAEIPEEAIIKPEQTADMPRRGRRNK